MGLRGLLFRKLFAEKKKDKMEEIKIPEKTDSSLHDALESSVRQEGKPVSEIPKTDIFEEFKNFKFENVHNDVSEIIARLEKLEKEHFDLKGEFDKEKENLKIIAEFIKRLIENYQKGNIIIK